MSGASRRIVTSAFAALVGLVGPIGVVAAAGPNELSNGWVSPTSGTTSTAFTFSVDYRSDREFAATSVVAVVAGRSVTLRLAGGNASAGTFRGTSALPAGRWPVTFQAQASQGPSPSLAGPTLVVAAPPPPPPPATPKPTPAPPPPPPSTPVPAPATTAPVPPTTTPATTPRPQPSAAVTTPAPIRSPGATSSPTDSAALPSTSIAASSTATPSATSGLAAGPGVGDQGGDGDDNPAGMLFGLGALSLAGLASLGVMITRRNRSREEPPQPAAERIPLVTPARPSRPAGIQPVEDPILVAMGLGTARHPDPDAPITRSVHSGPGERPPPPRPRAH